MNIRNFINRHGEIAGNLAALVAAIGFVIWMFGGRVFPWVTPAEADQLGRTQQTTIDAVAKLTGAVDRLTTRFDDHDAETAQKTCEDYTDRLGRARASLVRNPNDMSALDLQNASEEVMRKIKGCPIPPRIIDLRPVRAP